MLTRACLLLVCFSLFSINLKGQSIPLTTELEIRNDNDMYLFMLQDQYYTNGLFINLRKTFDDSKLKASELNRLMEFRIGHEMYNSYTAQIDSIEGVDRPITAHLYLSAALHHYFEGEDYLSYSLTVGSIGKRAFGEQLQANLHDLLNMYHAAGWEYQLNNAWTVDLGVQHNKLIGRTENQVLDFSWQSAAKLGNHHIHLKTGPLFRLGRLSAFDQSAHFGGRLQSRGTFTDKEWYLFYRPEVSAVFYDGTLQGGMWIKDKGPVTAEPYPFRISNHFGAIMSNDHLTFQMQYYFNTKESPQSRFRHQYGSVALAYRF